MANTDAMHSCRRIAHVSVHITAVRIGWDSGDQFLECKAVSGLGPGLAKTVLKLTN